MTEVLVCGISGWFTPHGTRYHEDRRRLDQIAPEDWEALLTHAEAIGFFTRPERGAAASNARIFTSPSPPATARASRRRGRGWPSR